MLPKFIQFSAYAVNYSDKSVALVSGNAYHPQHEFLPKSLCKFSEKLDTQPRSCVIICPTWLWLKLRHTEFYGEPCAVESLDE